MQPGGISGGHASWSFTNEGISHLSLSEAPATSMVSKKSISLPD